MLNRTDLHPVVACEIEFYLHGSHEHSLDGFWHAVLSACESQKIHIFKIEKERGHEQHEIALAPTDPAKAAQDCTGLKAILEQVAVRHGMKADFSAKPFADQPGSGLHVHVHLADDKGHNVFFKNDIRMSEELRYAIGGLLHHMKADMKIFVPTEESKKRFVAGSNAPMTVSWGANNRTVAVRLPDTAHEHKRIEHRVAGADADPKAVVGAIIDAIKDGLDKQQEPGPQIYGDAALEQYHLPKLIT